MAILPEYLVQTCGVSHHCAKSMADYLNHTRLSNDPIVVDSVLAGLRALHAGNKPSDSATNLASAWVYCMGFAIRDKYKMLKLRR